MEITFLGTGAAVAAVRYNAAMLVDRVLLLDAGAPLAVHLPRVGVPLSGPRAVLLTHFHADHTFGLASLILGRVLLDQAPGPLTIIGPAGTADYVTHLVEFAWGPEILKRAVDGRQLEVREVAGGEEFLVEGYQVTAYAMTHVQRFSCLGYVVASAAARLGYSGDAEPSPALEALLGDSDHAVVEMTYERPGPMHLSKPDVVTMIGRHPGVRFILTHLASEECVPGAVAAHDFLSLRLPLR